MKLSRCGWLAASLVAVSLSSAALAKNDADVALVAARSHFFGAENVDQRTGQVDKEKVIITWFSVQSYAVAAKGRVFLLDSYIYRPFGHPRLRPNDAAGAGGPRAGSDLPRARSR
jgi:hypothetical protein